MQQTKMKWLNKRENKIMKLRIVQRAAYQYSLDKIVIFQQNFKLKNTDFELYNFLKSYRRRRGVLKNFADCLQQAAFIPKLTSTAGRS